MKQTDLHYIQQNQKIEYASNKIIFKPPNEVEKIVYVDVIQEKIVEKIVEKEIIVEKHIEDTHKINQLELENEGVKRHGKHHENKAKDL